MTMAFVGDRVKDFLIKHQHATWRYTGMTAQEAESSSAMTEFRKLSVDERQLIALSLSLQLKQARSEAETLVRNAEQALESYQWWEKVRRDMEAKEIRL